jgi:hypothetical protein
MNNYIEYKYIPQYDNSYYYITGDNINLNIALDSNSDLIYYSNDYLFLLKNTESKINNIYTHVKKNINSHTYINEDVIPFITTFSTSVHAYCGIKNILKNYINNIDLYKNKKIIIYRNLTKGLLDIIKYFCHIKILNENNIIYIDENIVYKFNSITIIPNTLHSYFENILIRDEISDMFKNYIFEYKIPNSYKVNNFYESLAIIKHEKNGITSNYGSADYVSALNLMEKLNYKMIEAGEYNEIEFMQLIYNSKKIIFSWGTTFMKNFIYISDKCESMIVYIIGDEFLYEYNYLLNNNMLFFKYKNCNIEYKIVNKYLN